MRRSSCSCSRAQGCSRPEGQLVVNIHLVPADLVDPDHRADGLPVIELLPKHGLFFVDGQGGDLGQFAGEAAQDASISKLSTESSEKRTA